MANFDKRRFLLLTTDPVHIGTGGYRLGRVDNSIVREPGTNLPKIPGTSLHGAIRSYAARVYENPAAAGQNHSGADPDTCPVCYTFGYIVKKNDDAESDDDANGYSGVVSIFDAQLLLFPVHSMVGPVWVTTVSLLTAAGFTVTGTGGPDEPGEACFTWAQDGPLNAGWLMVHPAASDALAVVSPPPGSDWANTEAWRTTANRIVLVHDMLFTQIVNSNLEVRTSVSIDPMTGAAKGGALFTYEALPRAAFLTMDVVVDDYRDGTDAKTAAFAKCKDGKTKLNTDLPGGPWNSPLDVVAGGLKLLAWLGVGGMGTRGFGRLTQVGAPIATNYGGEG